MCYLFLEGAGRFLHLLKAHSWAPRRMRVAVRKSDVLSHVIANAICLLFCSACAFAQTPRKDPFPFDWMRPDAPPTNRTLTPSVIPAPEIIPEQAPVEAAPATVDEAPVSAEAAPAQESQPAGNIIPMPPNHPPAAQRQKAKPTFNEIEVTNARVLTLVEFKLAPNREDAKPLAIKPALQSGASVKVEVPIALGCAFTVWLEFTDGAPEQHEGVNLCNDKKINLIE